MSDKQYLDQTIRHAVYMERVKQSVVNDFDDTLAQIIKIINSVNIEELTQKQLEKHINDIYQQLMIAFGAWGVAYKSTLVEIFEDSVNYEVKSIVSAYAIEASKIVKPQALKEIATEVMTKPMPLYKAEGATIDSLLSSFTTTESKRITQAINLGYAEGKTNQQIVQQIRGTRANKYKDGIVDISTRNADTIARTGVQQIANQARLEVAKQNSDIVEMVEIIATLDSRTSQICRSMDKRRGEVGKIRLPPYHAKCRTTFIMVIKEPYAGRGNTDKRASMNGLVENQSYYEWLKTQPQAFQNDVLGIKRAKLLRDGGLSADEFARLNLGKNFEPLTLEEMRALRPNAFEKAGI